MREAYQEQIDQATGRLVALSRQTSEMIREATGALLSADIHRADAVIISDEQVDEGRANVDEQLLELIATQGPVAIDLRRLVAAFRISASLERMGDLASHVAKVARMRFPESAVPEELRTTFAAMGVVAEQMATKAGAVLRVQDAMAALRLAGDDDEMDRLHRSMFLVLLDDDWDRGTEAAIDMALLGRYYERFSDHVVNIANLVSDLYGVHVPDGGL